MRLLIFSLLFFSFTLSHAQEETGDVFGAKLHVFSGHFVPVEAFRYVYKKGRQLYGFDAMAGFKGYYLTGKYRIFETADNSKSQLLPDGGSAHWSQNFVFLGLRAYESVDFLSWYGEIGYVRSQVEETITAINPLYNSLDAVFKKNYHGIEIGTGGEISVWLISLETGLTYSYIPRSFRQESENKNVAGGLLFTIGLGLAL
jgi:hypothetical protein